MLGQKLKQLAATASMLALMCAGANAATITIAVTPTAAATFADVASDFTLANPTYAVSVVQIADTDAKDAIVSGGATGPYDLLIAQSPLLPAVLQYRYPTAIVGTPFAVAKDTLVVYSNSVDVSRRLPPGLVKFAIPDPGALDPYGLAGVEANLGGYLLGLAKKLVVKTSDAASSFAAAEYLTVDQGGAAYAFTGKSQICTAVTGVEEYAPSTYHHEYTYGKDYFTDIVLTGVKVARTRDADTETALSAFVTYLANGGGTTLKQHCYKLPG
jgi:molybdate transport system substrate-binding protein